MPSDGRKSPRAAIRDWLSHNDGYQRASTPRFNSREDGRQQRKPRERHRPRPHTDAEKVPLQPHTTRSRNHQGTDGDRFQKCSDAPTAARLDSGGVSLAERLNLHAPFRSFGDGNGYEDLKTSRLDHARKRRRSPSSASSFLEPAVLLEKSRTERMNRKAPRSHKRLDQYENESSQSFSGSSQSSSETATKTYERRSRHKTKEDRYELKQNKVMGKQKKQKKDTKKGEARKEKKSRLCKKSGAALMHDFAAQNVAQDRLTLKPTASIGLFKRGRASSPVRRRGLPDLTFSEMTFLNPRRDRSEEPVQSRDRKKRRTKDRAADTEAEISRYFASAKVRGFDAPNVPKERARSPPVRHSSRRDMEHYEHLDRSSLPPVELPDRPFLGFGSVGGSLVSPVKRDGLPVSPPQRFHSIHRDMSPTRSSSYFSWSKTGSPSHRSSRYRDTRSVPPVPPKRLRAMDDLAGDCSAGQTTISGVPLSRGDIAVDDKAILESKEGNGRTANAIELPHCLSKTSFQEKDLQPTPTDLNPTQQEDQYRDPKSAKEFKTQQPPKDESDFDKTLANPLHPKSTDPGFSRPEDLVNATLKLLLEKYGTAFNSSAINPDASNEKPKSLGVVNDEKDQHQIAQVIPNTANTGVDESIVERSNQNGAQESRDSPRPSTRHTVRNGSGPNDKPPEDNQVPDEAAKVVIESRSASHNSDVRQSPLRYPHPPTHHLADARNAWNGYNAIYEQQLTSEEPLSNSHEGRIRDDPSFEMNVSNRADNPLRYDIEYHSGPGIDKICDGRVAPNPYESNANDMDLETQSYRDQALREGIQSQHLNGFFHDAQAIEVLDEEFPDYEDEYHLAEHTSVVDYSLPRRGHVISSTGAFSDFRLAPQSIIADRWDRGHLPFQGRTPHEESPRAFHARPRTQDSTYSSIQQNLTALPDQTDDAFLPGFWKPHRLY